MAGSHSSPTVVEWAMAELINNPTALTNLRSGVDTSVGWNRLVKHSDVPDLPYFRAVIRETLRLRSPFPFALHECIDDCQVNDFLVRAKTRVLVNVQAIMLDPESWANPDEFLPERFMEGFEEKIGDHPMEFKGQNLRFLSFGSGRRGCLGASLAMATIHAVVGAMVQCFDWKVEGGEEKLDLKSDLGFTAAMAKSLMCYPVARMDPPPF